MTTGRRHPRRALCWSQAAPALRPAQRPASRAPATRARAAEPSPPSPSEPAKPLLMPGDEHPLTRREENERLAAYETSTKRAFDRIVPTLKEIAACQHDRDFERRAQEIASAQLGFRLPEHVLDHAWVEQLDMRTLFAWCVFETYRRFAGEFFAADPLDDASLADFDEFLQACGFHSFDLSPCSDGRLAHVVRYALRLPPRQVRRKSYAGAMFDVEESLDRWVETELNRFREGVPNTADQPTRYLKVAMYHYSGSAPGSEGCAAHGCDATRAAEAARERLLDFQQAIQNSFCCGASIDLLLLGIDTDTDTLRVHIPDADGALTVDRCLDAGEAYERTRRLAAGEVEDAIAALAAERAQADGAGAPPGGMLRLIARLLGNNFSQIDYVKSRHGGSYPDIGHQERFIGVGKGYDEIQLRNLTFFAHLKTVEEAACDLDVGIGIFTRLNAARGLPVPVIVRFDYHGAVPGARRRAEERCQRVSNALLKRYPDLAERGLLHTLLAIRDCRGDAPIEILGSSLDALTAPEGGAH
jgi:carboxysome shell carbonic anhydrase